MKKPPPDKVDLEVFKAWIVAFSETINQIESYESHLEEEKERQEIGDNDFGCFLEKYSHENRQQWKIFEQELKAGASQKRRKSFQDLLSISSKVANLAAEKFGGEWLIFFDLWQAVVTFEPSVVCRALLEKATYLLQLKLNQYTSKPQIESENDKRDQFMYREGMKGVPWKEIRAVANKQFPNTSVPETETGIQRAVYRYVKKHNLPPVPPRKK